MSFKDDFAHLQVQLQDTRLATNDFGDKPIGVGGFGKVFKGELSLLEGKKMVAFKRLDRRWGQGEAEFWKEIMMLSQYKHENLISLLGYCDEDGERILIYEYASYGSLDRHLGKTSLTWNQLLKICHGAACGLNYLHHPTMHQRLLHRDIKSANILLDDNLTAKISDFGLSKIGPANQPYTYLVSNVVGTPGYLDPAYFKTSSLSKESDVYSFGVVLFEVICGRYCFEYCNGELKVLVPLWKKCYEEDRMDDIVSSSLKQQMDMDSCKTFLNIAYRCLHEDQKARPTMTEIIKELELALDHQELSQDVDEKAKHEERVSIANQALTHKSYRSRSELALILSKGVVVDGGYRILIEKFIPSDNYQDALEAKGSYWADTWAIINDTHNLVVSLNSNFQLEASARFLSTHVTYNINLVYKYMFDYKSARAPFKYKLHTEKEYWTSCVAQERTDIQLSTKLYQFTTSQREHDFKFDFLGQLRPNRNFHNIIKPDRHDRRCLLHLIGIEFVPVEYEKVENLEEQNNVDMQPTMDLDTDWEKKLPSDYDELSKWLKDSMQWTTNKELYHLLRNGFLTNKNGEQWFSISKKMKKRVMLPPRAVLKKETVLKSFLRRKTWIWKSLPESRFQLVAEFCETESFTIACEIDSWLLSPETNYTCYLVYKLPESHSMVSGLIQIDDTLLSRSADKHNRWLIDKKQHVDLLTPTLIPFIGCDANVSHIPRRARRIKGHPKLRKDGWMEIQVWDFKSSSTNKNIPMNCRVRSYDKWKFTGILVQGIEFRPAKVSFMTTYRSR